MRGNNNASKQLMLITILTVILIFCVGTLIILNLRLLDRSVPVSSSVAMSEVQQSSDNEKSSQVQLVSPPFYDPPSSSSEVLSSKEEPISSQAPIQSEQPVSSCPAPNVYYPPMSQKPEPQPQTVIDVLTFNDIGEYEEYQIANYGYVYVGGVVIKNKTFNNDLIITDMVSYDNVTLDNVVVNGNIYIDGGCTITLNNVSAAGIVNQNNIINTDLILSGNTTVNMLTTKASIIIDEYGLNIPYEGIEDAIIEEGVKIWQNFELISGKLETLYVNDVTNVSVSSGSQINSITAIKKTHLKGKGHVETFYVSANGITFDLEPYYVYRSEYCFPPEISKKSIGEQ